MDGIKIEVTGNIARVIERPARITAGTVGLPIEFGFDNQWEGLSKTAVFKAGCTEMIVENLEVETAVPWEATANPNVWLSIGVYGVNADGSVAIPTIWANVCVICEGANPEGDVSTAPSLPVWQRLWNSIGNLLGLTTNANGNLVEAINEVNSIALAGGIESDPTLTQSGKAADAKATGDAIKNLTAADVGARPNTWMPTASQVGAVPTSRTVNGKALSSNITLSASDVGARPNTWTPTASDVGARPNTWMPTAADIGAAPSGFGLGTGGVYVPNSAVNDVFNGGFYRWDVDKEQTPFANATMLVVPRDKDSTATQIAFCNAATHKNIIAFRTPTKSDPGEWMFFNPYLSVGNEYLTIERWKGKPVYKKLISFGTLPASGEKNVSTGITFSNHEIVGYSLGLLHSGGEFVYFMTPNLTFGFYKSGDNWHATAEAHSDLSAYTVTVEISYVKKG